MVQIVYTNSKCSDIWEMFLGEQNKNTSWPLYFITDRIIPSHPKEKQFIYTETDNYSEIWVNVLKSINVDEFLYLQEDFILYDKIDLDKINEYINFLINSEYSFVRLLKSGDIGKQIKDTLYEITPDNE